MGHSINWDNPEKTVVLQAYDDAGTKTDLYALSTQSEEMLKSVDHTVHLIIDERNVRLTLNFTDMQFLQKHTPPNQGAVVMVVRKEELRYKEVIQQVGKAIAPEAFDKPFFASSVEEARMFLERVFEVQYPRQA